MTAPVASIPSNVRSDGIKSGLPVMGSQWSSFAGLVNWLNGRGNTLVTANIYGKTIADTANETFRYYIWPHYEARYRVWVVVLKPGSVNGGTVSVDGGAAQDWWVTGGEVCYFTVVQSVAQSSSATSTTINIAVSSDAANSAEIHQIMCYELPRVELDLTNDRAADFATVLHEQVIQADVSRKSVDGVVDGEFYAEEKARRAGMFHCYLPTGIYFLTSDTAFMFPYYATYYGCELLGRLLHNGDTLREVEFAIYANVNVTGASGVFTMELASGDTAQFAVTNTAPAWLGPTTINVYCEDMTENDGTRGGTDDYARFYGMVNATSTTTYVMTVYGISVGEAEEGK